MNTLKGVFDLPGIRIAKPYLWTGAYRARRLVRDLAFAAGGERKFRETYFADVPVNPLLLRDYRAENFPASGPVPWLDRPDACEQIDARVAAGVLSSTQASQCTKWVKDGYIILENPYPEGFLDRVWRGYQNAVDAGIVPLAQEKAGESDAYPGRSLNPHFVVPELDEFLRSAIVGDWVSLLLGKTAAPFQTITAHKGSQQLEHSDSIHMTTYPEGFMCASWTAFEDIHPDSGPLVYYPGTHRWSYAYSKQAGIAPGEVRQHGYPVYGQKYEPFIQRLLRDRNPAPEYFHARRGDVLIWHANLLHGGSPRRRLEHSRRSIVCHYFVDGALCYHDLSGEPAQLRRTGSAGYGT